jgi:hypothetical protein
MNHRTIVWATVALAAIGVLGTLGTLALTDQTEALLVIPVVSSLAAPAALLAVMKTLGTQVQAVGSNVEDVKRAVNGDLEGRIATAVGQALASRYGPYQPAEPEGG